MAECKRLHTPDGTPPSHRTLVTPNHSAHVVQMLKRMYEDEHLCDYTIIAEGQAFRTHRNILASVSDYFNVMLTGTMIEARQDHVELKGITANAMKLLLDFAYSGQLTLNLEEIVEVLSASCHLQMCSATELACDFLLGEICTKTCVDILSIGDMFSLAGIRAVSLGYILENFDKVADGEQFYKMQSEHLLEILQKDNLRCTTELALFRHLTSWIDFDAERMCLAAELLPYIRFALISPEELVDYVVPSKFIVNDPVCRALVDEAFHYHVLPNRHPLLQTPRTRVRNTECIVGLGGRYGMSVGYKHNSNKMYALHDGKWTQLPSGETNFLYSAMAVVNNFLYVCGGMGKPAHARATCHRFDPRTCLWTRLARMKSRRQSFPLVGIKDRLLAFGGGVPMEGSFEHPPTDKCEVYSVDKNEWSVISPLPGRRKSMSACAVSGKVYLSGGRTDTQTVTSLWCYDVPSDQWTVKSPMLQPHTGHAMVAVNSSIFVIDRTDLGMETYNAVTDEWTKLAGPRVPMGGVARPGVLGSWVYFISYMQDGQDYKCRRVNVVTQRSEDLPDYPDYVHCVAGAALSFPRQRLVDSNNNSSNTSSASASFTTSC